MEEVSMAMQYIDLWLAEESFDSRTNANLTLAIIYLPTLLSR